MEKLSVAVVPMDFLEQLNGMLEKINNFLNERTSDDTSWKWIESKFAMEMFTVSPKTWQKWRDSGEISYSRYGDKIYYHLDDLNRFLEERKIAAN